MFNLPIVDDCETKKDGQAKDPANALHIVREAEAKDLHVFIRGKVDQKGPSPAGTS